MKNEKNEKGKEPLHNKMKKVYIFVYFEKGILNLISFLARNKERENLSTYPLIFQDFYNRIFKV
jgi:hypothetical protein